MKVKYIASFAIISILSVGLISCSSDTPESGTSETTTIEEQDPCAGKKDPCAGKKDPCAGEKDPCAAEKK